MEITIKAEPKEIAALVLAVQERQEEHMIKMPSYNFGLHVPEMTSEAE